MEHEPFKPPHQITNLPLAQIAQGWYDFIKGSPETKRMMTLRLSICDSCEYKKQLSGIGQLIITTINQNGSTYKCGKCNCPLATKTAAKNATCPLQKWGVWTEEKGYY